MTAPYYFYKQTLLKPEVYQSMMLAKFAAGKFVERGEFIPPFLRAQVISFDSEGGLLENPGGEGTARSKNPQTQQYYDIKARVGPKNPPRSLRARIVTHQWDKFTDDADLRVYWPLFPSTGPDPVNLEFVYVFFEDSDKKHGLWVAKVPGPFGESTNFAPGHKPYEEAADSGTGGKKSLAAASGDSPPSQGDYKTQEAIVGSKPDDSRQDG